MRFLIDECLHTSLVREATKRGHEAHHVNWLGLSGTSDRDLMPRIVAEDFTFVTNNARDFRRLYAKAPLHAGLVIIVPQLVPDDQVRLFGLVCDEFFESADLVNEGIEVMLEDKMAVFRRYALAADVSGGMSR